MNEKMEYEQMDGWNKMIRSLIRSLVATGMTVKEAVRFALDPYREQESFKEN